MSTYDQRSNHHVHRGAESLPCYCEATSDHSIGQEKVNIRSIMITDESGYTSGFETYPSPQTHLDVDALAQEIRRVDGSHSLGAGTLAEALMPFLLRNPAPQPKVSPSTDDKIDAWHDGHSSETLRDHLGMSEEVYRQFVDGQPASPRLPGAPTEDEIEIIDRLRIGELKVIPAHEAHVTGLDQVEKVAAAIWHEGYGKYRPPGKDEWPDGVIVGSQDLFRAMARAAIAAASPQPKMTGDVLRILQDKITDAEADMQSDADAGERVDLFDYEIELPLNAAKEIVAALSAPPSPRARGIE